MADYVKVAQKKDLAPGSVKTVIVSGKAIAVANVDGEFFALDDACTHRGCSLGGEGMVEGKTLVCGCHGAKFDLTDGRVLALPATIPLKTYPVKIEGEEVLVEV